MKDARLRRFVDRRLTAMHARPSMWAGSKEAFALQVALLIEIASEDFDCQQPVKHSSHALLQKFFPGRNSVPSEPIDDAWARDVIEIARKELP